jgi:peptidyl-prolyl cis-trans isomerase-like 4
MTITESDHGLLLFKMFHRLGSQFFITLGENLDYLDKEHCVFGEVSEGHDTLLKINDSICDEMHVPYQDIR